MDLVVVKIGGSLAKDRQWAAWLDVLAGRGGPLIVVPGGGAFADCVRAQQRVMGFSDKAAHRMALSAMGQFGMALAAQSPVFQLRAQEERSKRRWEPGGFRFGFRRTWFSTLRISLHPGM